MKKPGRVWLEVAALFAAWLCAVFIVSGGHAAERRHGLSSFGALKYSQDFQHFDYVNPDAPKGGRLWTVPVSSILTFNHFNAFIREGDPAEGLTLLFDTLMARAMDEPDAVYGLAAESAEVADDRKSVTFLLRPEARFRDGTSVTADDLVFSLDILKAKGAPSFQLRLQDVMAAKPLDARTVRYEFRGENLRDLPLTVATLPILSRSYYTGRDFTKESLDPPLGSGPYELAGYRQGAYVAYRRRLDYWAASLPVNRGRFNFDEVRFDYYRDRAVSLEAFKANAYDLREEFTSKSWATEYDFPAVKSGQVKRMTLADGSPSGAQGFFINTRREKFKDVRVRTALDYAFDFEWTNKTLFYGTYTRVVSYFENSDLKAEGPPQPDELALLEPYRAMLSPQVFEDAYKPPVTDGSGRFRQSLRMASQLLDEAGWTLQGGVRRNGKGETLDIEFLIEDPTTERILSPYAEKLMALGIRASLRRIDAAQEQKLLKTFDFDIVVQRYSLSQTPGPEVRAFWSSQAARDEGSYNLPGIADAAVDALIDKVLQATSRTELRTACRSIDRVLRAGHYWVPQWYKPSHHIAMWDKFAFPANKPSYDRAIIDTWWFDSEKAHNLGK